LQSSNDAIRDFDDLKACAFRDSLDWLDHPVLVSVRQFLQNPEKVSVTVPLSRFVGLVSPHNCSICSSYSRQPALQGTVELGPLIGDGEIDKLFLPLGQAGSASTLVERPSEMVEAAPVVVNDVTEQKAPLLREDGRDLVGAGGDDDAVTLGVVLVRHPETHWCRALSCKFVDVVFEYLRVDYRLSPLEPGTLESVRHAANPNTTRKARQGLFGKPS
jgi:hypothetical protein